MDLAEHRGNGAKMQKPAFPAETHAAAEAEAGAGTARFSSDAGSFNPGHQELGHQHNDPGRRDRAARA